MPETKRYKVVLTEEDKNEINRKLRSKSTPNTIIRRCRILPDPDEANGNEFSREQCAKRNGVCITTVVHTAAKFSEHGIKEALSSKRNINSDNSRRKLDGRAEARIIEIATSPAPDGHARWTLRLLEKECKVALETPVSKSTIGRALKNALKPHKSEYWCVPKKHDAEFAACMEDVLDVYEMPYNHHIPVVCMDEMPYQLLDDLRPALPVRCNDIKKIDYEYVRNGTCSIFAFIEPLAGCQHISVRERRTAVDWAEEIKFLVDEMYPDAEKIILVMDNLNTHVKGSLYKKYPPEEARQMIKRLEFHYTPKHGSWLNIAEIELNILSRQCLSRRLPSIDIVRAELAAWESGM